MSDLERLARLRALAAKLAKDADRAEGVTDAVRKQLRKEFGICNDRDLEEKLSEMLSDEVEWKGKTGTMIDDFEREYGEKL